MATFMKVTGLLIGVLFAFSAATAQNTEQLAEELKSFYPADIDGLEQETIQASDAPYTIDGIYQHIDSGAMVLISLAVGPGIQTMRERIVEPFLKEFLYTEKIDHQGTSLEILYAGMLLVVHGQVGDIGIFTGLQGRDLEMENEVAVEILLQAIDSMNLSEMSEWQVPEGYTFSDSSTSNMGYHSEMNAPFCEDEDCFEEYFSACEPAVFIAESSELGASVQYLIDGEASDGTCSITFTFLNNPNENWIGKPLYLTLDNSRPFGDQIQQAFADCLSGDKECYGALMMEF